MPDANGITAPPGFTIQPSTPAVQAQTSIQAPPGFSIVNPPSQPNAAQTPSVPAGFQITGTQPKPPSTWDRIKQLWQTASTVPVPELVGRLFGPRGTAAAQASEASSPENVAMDATQYVAGKAADSGIPVLSQIGSAIRGVSQTEQGALRSSESPVGVISTLAGAEPIEAALPTAAKVAATGSDLAFAGQGVSQLAEPKQKGESDEQYALRVGSGVAQVLIPAIGSFARFAETDAVGESAKAKLGEPSATQIAQDAQAGKASIVPDSATVPVISKPDVLAAATTKLLEVSDALKQSGIDPSTVRTPEDVNNILSDAMDVVRTNLDPRIVNTITFPLQKQLADDLGMSVDDLLSSPSGTAANAETLLASRAILDSSAKNLLDAAKAVQPGDKAGMNSALDTLAQHVLVVDKVSGFRSEAGRALGSLRNDNLPSTQARVSKALTALRSMPQSGKVKAIELLGKLDMSDQRAVNQFVQQITPASTGEKVFEFFRNALLSSPHVLLVKGASELLTGALETMRLAVGGTIKQARAMAHGTLWQLESTETEESPADALLFGRGVWESFRDLPAVLSGKLNLHDAPDFEKYGKRAIKGTLGDFVNTPGTVLNRETNAVYLMNYRGMLHVLAGRAVKAEGLTGDDAAARLAYLAANPTDEMSQAAHQFALHNTFQSKLGPFGASIQNAIGKANVAGVPVGRFLFPFLRTPVNLLKTSAEYSPIGLVSGHLTGDIDAISRGIIGSSIAAGLAYGVMAGHVTGGGNLNFAKRDAQESTGFQPYSVKIGNRYYSYHRAEPLGMALGMVADAVHAMTTEGHTPSTQNRAQQAVEFISNNMRNFPLMSQLSLLANLVSGTGAPNAAMRLVRSEARGFVPSIVGNVARIIDPVERNPQTISQSIESEIPFASRNVPAKLDTSGQPQRSPSDLGGISPFPVSRAKNDAAMNEIARLGVPEIEPLKSLTIGRGENQQAIVLSPAESQALQRQDAQMLHDYLAGVIGSDEWKSLSDAERKEVIERVRNNIAKTRRGRFLQMREQTESAEQ